MSSPTYLGLPTPHNRLALRGRLDPQTNARKKWGDDVFEAGYQLLPDTLLRCQRFLELEPIDLVILMNIAMHWWGYDDFPFPTPSAISTGISSSSALAQHQYEQRHNISDSIKCLLHSE